MDTARVQLALNVDDLDAAVDFYGKLFDAQPHKRRDGYANFAISNPPLKLVLIENPGAGGLNHLGVEVATTEQVGEAADRFALQQMDTLTEEGVDCCYAVQDKVWVTSPEGERWEVYTVLDEEGMVGAGAGDADASGCCSTGEGVASITVSASASGCC